MLKIKLVGETSGMLEIEKYELTFPFSIYGENNGGNEVWWNLNSVECENLKGSFRLSYCNKIDFGENKTKTTNGSTIEHVQTTQVAADAASRQYFLFPQRQLLYFNEKDISSSLRSEKKKLSRFLLKSEAKAKETIQFFITYTNKRKIHNERLNFFFNLF